MASSVAFSTPAEFPQLKSRSVESVPQDVPFQTGSRVTAGSASPAAPSRAGASREAAGKQQGRCEAGAVAAAGGRRAGPLAQGRYLCCECRCAGLPRACAPGPGGAGGRVSPGAGISVMRCCLVLLPKPSYKQRVFAPLFFAPCLCSAPSVLPALLRSASCFSFPSERRCYSSPERVIFIGPELIPVCGCGLCLWQANAGAVEAVWRWSWCVAEPQGCRQDGRELHRKHSCASSVTREAEEVSAARTSRGGGTKSHNLPRLNNKKRAIMLLPSLIRCFCSY